MNNNTVTTSPKQNKRRIKNDIGEAKKEEECDAEAWDTLSKSFKQVQSVLDHNSDLIKQVNANHQSKIPDNLVKNVSLIREINGNISKEDDFKPAGLGFTALYAYVIRYLCSVYLLFFPVLLSLLLYVLAKLLTEAAGGDSK